MHQYARNSHSRLVAATGASVLLPQQSGTTVCGARLCAVGAVEHINCLRPGLLSCGVHPAACVHAVCACGCDMVCVILSRYWQIAPLVGGSPLVVLLVLNSQPACVSAT